jgi:indole-3-glycerol phosphate synthase
MPGRRRFSHAIAEGDGISVIAAVADPDAARDAESQRAEALLVRGDASAVREASQLPVLSTALDHADAVLVTWDDNDLHEQVTARGLEYAIEVRNEEDLEQALEELDPEIFLLSPSEGDDTPLECVLDLLAAVPAGKLAIADLPHVTPAEAEALENAGCDAVIVRTGDIAALAGDSPPDV